MLKVSSIQTPNRNQQRYRAVHLVQDSPQIRSCSFNSYGPVINGGVGVGVGGSGIGVSVGGGGGTGVFVGGGGGTGVFVGGGGTGVFVGGTGVFVAVGGTGVFVAVGVGVRVRVGVGVGVAVEVVVAVAVDVPVGVEVVVAVEPSGASVDSVAIGGICVPDPGVWTPEVGVDVGSSPPKNIPPPNIAAVPAINTSTMIAPPASQSPAPESGNARSLPWVSYGDADALPTGYSDAVSDAEDIADAAAIAPATTCGPVS